MYQKKNYVSGKNYMYQEKIFIRKKICIRKIYVSGKKYMYQEKNICMRKNL